jgi:hypothetical protein
MTSSISGASPVQPSGKDAIENQTQGAVSKAGSRYRLNLSSAGAQASHAKYRTRGLSGKTYKQGVAIIPQQPSSGSGSGSQPSLLSNNNLPAPPAPSQPPVSTPAASLPQQPTIPQPTQPSSSEPKLRYRYRFANKSGGSSLSGAESFTEQQKAQAAARAPVKLSPFTKSKLEFNPRLTSINVQGKTYFVASLQADQVSQSSSSSSHAREDAIGTRRIAISADVSPSMTWLVGSKEIWQLFKNFVKELSADEFKALCKSAKDAEALLQVKLFTPKNKETITKYIEPSAMPKFISAFAQTIQPAQSPQLVGLEVLEEIFFDAFEQLSQDERRDLLKSPKAAEAILNNKVFTAEKRAQLAKYFDEFALAEHIKSLRTLLSKCKDSEVAKLLAEPQEVNSILHQKFDNAFDMKLKKDTLEMSVGEFFKSRMSYQQKALIEVIDNELRENDEFMLFAFDEKVRILQSSHWGFQFVAFEESKIPNGITITRENKELLKRFVQSEKLFRDPDTSGTNIMAAVNAMQAFQENAARVDQISGIVIPGLNVLLTDGEDPRVTKAEIASSKAKYITSVPTSAVGISEEHDKDTLSTLSRESNGAYIDSSDLSKLSPALKQLCRKVKGVVTGKSQCTISGVDGASVGNIWHQGKLAPQKTAGELASSETFEFPSLYMGRVQRVIFEGEPKGKYKVLWTGKDFTNGQEFTTDPLEKVVSDIQEDPENIYTAQKFSIFEPALQDVLSASSKEERVNILRGAVEALPVENSQLKASLLKVMQEVEDGKEGDDLQKVIDEVLAHRHETTFTDSTKQMHLMIKRLASQDKFLNVHSSEARKLLQGADEGDSLWRLTSNLCSDTETGQLALSVKRSDLTTRDGVKGLFEEVFFVTDKGELLCNDETSPFKGLYKNPDEALEAFKLKTKSSSAGAGSGLGSGSSVKI